MTDNNKMENEQIKHEVEQEGVTHDAEQDVNENDSPSKFQHYFVEKTAQNSPKLTHVLQTFLKLKEIDSELSEIEDEKGDLPENIEKLNRQCEFFKEEYRVKKSTLNSLVEEKSVLEAENTAHEQKIGKYDEQKYNVRSNEEYDGITKTVDALFEEVKRNEGRLKEIESLLSGLDDEIEELENKVTEYEAETKEKQDLLDELNEQYKQEETALREQREAEISKLDESHRFLYENVNKMYNGEAAAIVRKGNCSGCYNSIPPQRVIEIRAAEKVFTCQSCGRILVSEEHAVS